MRVKQQSGPGLMPAGERYYLRVVFFRKPQIIFPVNQIAYPVGKREYQVS